MFVCKRCGCDNQIYFGIKNGEKYCRRCIGFKGDEAKVIISKKNKNIKPVLNYSLTKDQLNISLKVKNAIENNKNVLIYAVCGAGKTEIVFETIAYALSRVLQVGFAIPRKDVVIELEPRLKEAFPSVDIVSVYGGNTSVLEGDIILLTTHQLYRYENYFDLLIIDETDAFPFSDNETLMNMFNNSIRGNYIMMSATPLDWMKEKIKKEDGIYLSLMKRHHGHPLIVPKIKIIPFFQSIYIINKIIEYKKENKPCFIFCPTINEAETLFNLLKLFFKDIRYVHSKKDDRQIIIDEFKKGRYQFLITTSVLERGVTVKNLQVIVLNASHPIYNSETLIQISGRVGRKTDAFDGDVLFLAKKSTLFIENCVKKIKEANEYEPL